MGSFWSGAFSLLYVARLENNDRINFEGNEYIKCDRFFVDKLTNPKKEEFKYQKELVYVNQLQLLKFLLAETNISTFQLHAFYHLDP